VLQTNADQDSAQDLLEVKASQSKQVRRHDCIHLLQRAFIGGVERKQPVSEEEYDRYGSNHKESSEYHSRINQLGSALFAAFPNFVANHRRSALSDSVNVQEENVQNV